MNYHLLTARLNASARVRRSSLDADRLKKRIMDRLYDVITFDCYGTLIDWESGIAAAFLEAARADGLALDRGEVLRAYAEMEPVVEAEAYRSYREILSETARRVAARLG